MTEKHSRSMEPHRKSLAHTYSKANANETLQHRVNELEDYVVALKEQIAGLKESYKIVEEERDAAVINYAVAEGKLLELNISKFKSKCRQCHLKDGVISNSEKLLEGAKSENAKLVYNMKHMNDMTANLEKELKEERLKNERLMERLNHYEKKRKRKVSQSQQQRYHNCDNGLPLSPTMEPEPAKCSYQVPTAAASRGIKDEVLQQSALKGLLFKNDQLVEDLAISFEPTCIQGKTGSWISLCSYLKIDSANLTHIESKSRLLDIIKEFEKSSDHDISITELSDIFRAVGNENSACRLLRCAQMHIVIDDKVHTRGRHKTPHRVKDQFNEDVSDSDLDSTSSEDWIIV